MSGGEHHPEPQAGEPLRPSQDFKLESAALPDSAEPYGLQDESATPAAPAPPGAPRGAPAGAHHWPRIGRPLIAWGVILLLVGVQITLQQLAGDEAMPDEEGVAQFELHTQEFEGKLLVGAKDLAANAGTPARDLADSVTPANSPAGKLAQAVLLGELSGPKSAVEMLGDRDFAEVEKEDVHALQKYHEILEQLYGDYVDEQWEAPSVEPSERKLLVEEFGWFGRLALAPAQHSNDNARRLVLNDAYRVLVATLAIGAGILLLLVLGMGIAGVLSVMALGGNLRRRLRSGAPHGAVYAETFAVWLLVFAALSIGAAIVSETAPLGESRFIPLIVGFGGSLIALAWPVVRGVPWRQVRRDLGLYPGRNPLVEIVYGVMGWIATLPLLVLGILMTLLLLWTQAELGGGDLAQPGESNTPMHPIVPWLTQAGWWGRVQILVLACVMAPLIEETMFRGALYRQLRDATARWSVLGSVLIAVTITGLLFAAIHPQGLFAIPPLGALATGFALLREWRGSLLASMTAHGLNNLLAVGLLLVMIS